MVKQPLSTLCDIATEAHTLFQQTYTDSDPIVGVSQNMRANHVPADVMTIDCLKSGKRILLILHDQQPDQISYQFGFMDKEPDRAYERISFESLTSAVLYHWMKDCFRPA